MRSGEPEHDFLGAWERACALDANHQTLSQVSLGEVRMAGR